MVPWLPACLLPPHTPHCCITHTPCHTLPPFTAVDYRGLTCLCRHTIPAAGYRCCRCRCHHRRLTALGLPDLTFYALGSHTTPHCHLLHTAAGALPAPPLPAHARHYPHYPSARCLRLLHTAFQHHTLALTNTTCTLPAYTCCTMPHCLSPLHSLLGSHFVLPWAFTTACRPHCPFCLPCATAWTAHLPAHLYHLRACSPGSAAWIPHTYLDCCAGYCTAPHRTRTATHHYHARCRPHPPPRCLLPGAAPPRLQLLPHATFTCCTPLPLQVRITCLPTPHCIRTGYACRTAVD